VENTEQSTAFPVAIAQFSNLQPSKPTSAPPVPPLLVPLNRPQHKNTAGDRVKNVLSVQLQVEFPTVTPTTAEAEVNASLVLLSVLENDPKVHANIESHLRQSEE
jgi:hypothetical protein